MTSERIIIGPEERALLLLSGMKPLQGARDALGAITSPERFVWLANEHGVAGFVRENLKASDLTCMLPLTEYQRLRTQAFKSIARSTFIMTALIDAVRLLNAAGIVPVLLKGTALEMTIYGNSGLRPMTDADILVPPEDAMRAWTLLKDAGYNALPFKSPLYKLIPLHTGKHLPSLIRNGFSLEIHHSLFWQKAEDVTELILEQSEESGAQSAERRVQGTGRQPEPPAKFKIPPPGLHFLYLISHLVKHELNNDSQLRLYNDLTEVLRHYGAATTIDTAMKYAVMAGLQSEVRTKLAILNKYLGVDLPIGTHYELPASGEAKFLRFLACPKNNPPENRKAFYKETIRAVPGLHRKLIYVAGDIFPGISFMKRRYGKRTILGVIPYYLYRLGKLTWLL